MSHDQHTEQPPVVLPHESTRIVIELHNGCISSGYFVAMLKMFMREQRWAPSANGLSGDHYHARVVTVETIDVPRDQHV